MNRNGFFTIIFIAFELIDFIFPFCLVKIIRLLLIIKIDFVEYLIRKL